MANTLLCKLTAARPSTLRSEIACSARRVGRDRRAFTNATPAWSVSTLNASRSGIIDFQWALLGMFQFCGHNSLGFVLVLYVYNCNMSHSKLKPIYRLCPARLTDKIYQGVPPIYHLDCHLSLREHLFFVFCVSYSAFMCMYILVLVVSC